jgi:fatty acid-binding protein DegV
LGKASALLGTVLNIKPIVALGEGEVIPVEKARSQKRAIERLAEIVLASGPIQELAVMHASGLALATQLKGIFGRTLNEDDILIGETGPVLGTYTGTNAVGAAWINGKY